MVLVGIYYGFLMAGLAMMLVPGLGWLAFITYFLGMPLGALALWRIQGDRFCSLGLGYYADLPQHILVGTVGAAGVVGILLGTMYLADWVTVSSLHRTVPEFVLGVVAQQAVVATLEELTFRGVIQHRLEKSLGSVRGWVLASILFSLFHLPNIVYREVPPRHIPLTAGTLILMGLVFGSAFSQTAHHLALPIALHFGWNVMSFGIEDSLAITFSGPAWLVGVAEWFPESGLLGTLGLLVLGGWVQRTIGQRDSVC
jgi:membrane protease YdiL (CAAX protease family)